MLFHQVFHFVSNFSVAIAAIIGLIRFRVVLKSYRPFILFNCLGLVNELVSHYCTVRFKTNAVNSNIYVLFEFLILFLLFKNWGIQQRRKGFYTALITIVIAVWIWDSLINHPITEFSSVYRIIYSVVLIFLSVDQVNYIIVTERKNILRNSRFIICSALIIYFTYKATLESFYAFELDRDFLLAILRIYRFVNLFLNLAFAFATLWIPTKQRFTLPY